MDKLVIIDGNSIAYRAYYALPMLHNRDWVPTNAVYGFMNMFLKVIDDLMPTHMAVVFDFPAKTFRHEMYGDYKATRKPMPEYLKQQMPIIKDLLRMMGVMVFEREGFEADDVVGTLAKRFSEKTVIVTGDKDCLQLLDDTTDILLMRKGVNVTEIITPSKFEEEYGFKPIHIIDLKAIMGDTSDNIPGVKGIGEKGAMELIQKYGTLENVYEHLDELPRVKNKLTEQKEMAFLSKELATINSALNVGVLIEELKFKFAVNADVRDKLTELELFNLLNKLNANNSNAIEYDDGYQKKIVDISSNEILKNIKTPLAVLLTENALHFATDDKINYEIKFKTNLIDDGVTESEALNFLKPVLEDDSIKKLCFDFKSFKHELADFGVNLQGLYYDVHLASWVSDSTNKSDKINQLFASNGLSEINAVNLFRAKNIFDKEMKRLDVEKIYYDIELPLIDVLYDMEVNGMKVDPAVLNELLEEYSVLAKAYSNKIFEYAGEEFNLNSPKELGAILYDKLGLRGPKNKSTAVEVLTKLRGDHPIIEAIIQYRTLSKIVSTYLVAFKDLIKEDNLIHTTFVQTGTMTGRLASKDPNMQNIPVKKEEGKNLRKMFITRFDGGQIVSADYNQIELRLVAAVTGDEKMIETFSEGRDIHQKTASEIFNVPLNEVTPSQRIHAKAVNFGIIYGISAFGLSEQIGILSKEAGEYIDRYYASFPKIKEHMENSIAMAKQNNGYISTLYGRKRRVPEVLSPIYQTRQFGERVVMNMPFQGTASDIIKMAMLKVYAEMKRLKLKSKLISQVHDELLVDATAEEVEVVKKLLKETMENVVHLAVPLTVDVESGSSWYNME